MDTFQQGIDSFQTLAPLLIPELVSPGLLEGIAEYDDYVLLFYNLAYPLDLERVMDDFEDHMHLNILYHMRTRMDSDAGQHCCAYASPSLSQMYKLNVQTGPDGLVHDLSVYIFSSLEYMLEALKEDLKVHEGMGVFKARMPYGRIIADYM